LVRAREFAESIAMFDGGMREYERSRDILNALILNNSNVIWTMFGYEAFQAEQAQKCCVVKCTAAVWYSSVS